MSASVFSRLWALVSGKGRAADPGRLPLPRGGGYAGVGYSGGQFSFLDHFTVGGRALPIQPKDAGDPLLNPIVAICLGWIGTSWPLAVPQVGRVQAGQFNPDPGEHPFLELLRRPNPTYGGKWLFWALNSDYWTRGNAYAEVLTGRGGAPAELNYLPARCVRPQPDTAGYLSHYEYTTEHGVRDVDPERIVRFRYGVNPDNVLEGISPLTSAFRELVADNAASDYGAGLFNNGGVPPWIISPKAIKDGAGLDQVLMSPEEARALTETLHEFIKQRPGQGRFLPGAVDMHQLAFEPGKMGLELVREEPETRIPALFQIPPVVLGLRAGLLKSTYNNVKEAKSAAWHGCLIPTQDYFAEELTNQVLRRFPGSAEKVLRYDRSHIGELQPDQNAVREQARADQQAGIITIEEAREEQGRETTPQLLSQLEAEHPAPVMGPGFGAGPPEPGQKARRLRIKVSQADFDVLHAGCLGALEELASQLVAGTLTVAAWEAAMVSELSSRHQQAAMLGRVQAGLGTAEITDSDREAAAEVVAEEQRYLAAFRSDIESGRYDAKALAIGGLTARASLYAGKLLATASRAFAKASDTLRSLLHGGAVERYHWRMSGDEGHCERCPELAANGPYKSAELPTYPRAGATPCMSNCRCFLVRESDGVECYAAP